LTKSHVIIQSRPGPVESALLRELSPPFEDRRRLAGLVSLRSLEGGEGPPVVLLHGRGHAASMWQPLLPLLARHSRVVAVDLPGFGHSASRRFSGADPQAALDFFVDPVEALLVDLGLEEAALVGHSLGGFVAVELCLRRRVRPRRLVLIGSMGLGPAMRPMARAFFRAVPERLARALGPSLFEGLLGVAGNALPPRLAALEGELHVTTGGKGPPAAAFNALFPMVGPAFHRGERLGEIGAETLIVWGDRDAAFPAPTAIAAAAAMPRAEVLLQPGLGHSPHLEDTASVGPAIAGFVAGR
jgi:pimeloyl-ACP methyl ester carboxylesterase